MTRWRCIEIYLHLTWPFIVGQLILLYFLTMTGQGYEVVQSASSEWPEIAKLTISSFVFSFLVWMLTRTVIGWTPNEMHDGINNDARARRFCFHVPCLTSGFVLPILGLSLIYRSGAWWAGLLLVAAYAAIFFLWYTPPNDVGVVQIRSVLLIAAPVFFLIAAFFPVDAAHWPTGHLSPSDGPSSDQMRDPCKPDVKLPFALDQAIGRWRAQDHRSRTMFLVAAAGGGACAAYWTASVLGAIQDSQPDFARQLFAVSAVSGGALGGAAFETLGADPPTCRIEGKESRSFRECLAEFLSYDFLSPVMASYLTGYLVNRFVPLERVLANRAEALELSWERAWGNMISGPNWMRAPFDERWMDRKFQINLLLNGTNADAGVHLRAGDPPTLRPGERAVTSNLQLIDQTGVMIPNPASYGRLSLSTAIDNSTRFPLVEPVGGVTPHLDSRTTNTTLSTYYLADGGYYDNYGAATLLDLIRMLKNQWSTLNIDKLVIIQISSNSEISSKFDGKNTPSKPSPLPMTAGPIVACRGWSEPPGAAGEATHGLSYGGSGARMVRSRLCLAAAGTRSAKDRAGKAPRHRQSAGVLLPLWHA